MSSTQSIGGYFELELRQHGSLFHNNAAALNSGRNAFAYILESRTVKKIYLPLYICPVILQPLNKLKINYDFYSINENLEPNQKVTLGGDEYLLYVNYFGIKNSMVQKLAQNYANTIIDNAQAFFDLPQSHTPTFYSPRKFFGVPDGGFVYTDCRLQPMVSQKEISFSRCAHLLKRIEFGASEGFAEYKFHEKEFDNRSIARMSGLTKKILLNIDYEWVRHKRDTNFIQLHNELQKSNRLSHIIDGSTINGPMTYPYLCDEKNLRKHLHENNIFTPIYWSKIPGMDSGSNNFESYLVEHLTPLPIDQRYGRNDMNRIVSGIKECNG
jgi:hypothetical protein